MSTFFSSFTVLWILDTLLLVLRTVSEGKSGSWISTSSFFSLLTLVIILASVREDTLTFTNVTLATGALCVQPIDKFQDICLNVFFAINVYSDDWRLNTWFLTNTTQHSKPRRLLFKSHHALLAAACYWSSSGSNILIKTKCFVRSYSRLVRDFVGGLKNENVGTGHLQSIRRL